MPRRAGAGEIRNDLADGRTELEAVSGAFGKLELEIYRLREVHDAVLRQGGIPLGMIRRILLSGAESGQPSD